ncbi:MAG: fibronectin type III domain-containing protein [Nitrospirae bacterium]|nr:fibronectin type III domain-containing protein [Nitrospirota bacterium]
MNLRCHNCRHLFLILAAVLLTTTISGCGKKGDLTLKAYERPETPSRLTAVHREDALYLKWAYPPAKENLITEFIVMRSSGSDFEKLSSISREMREYIDIDFRPGSTYEYRVLSQNLRGIYSNDSAIASVAPVQAPLPPAKLSYTVSEDTVTIAWKHADTGTLFNVYRSPEKGKYGMSPVNTAPLSEPRFNDALSVNNVNYYTVRSLTGSSIRDEGPASEELKVDPADLVPSMPLHLQAFPAHDKVFLLWKEVDERWVTGFKVYRRTDNNDYVLLGKTQTPTFLDSEAPVTKRDYRVTAAGPAKEGPAAEIKNIIYIPQQ